MSTEQLVTDINLFLRDHPSSSDNVDLAMALHYLEKAAKTLEGFALALEDSVPKPRVAAPPTVEVMVVGDDDPMAIAKLMVNGYGVAQWFANQERYRLPDCTGREYAEECARVLRLALSGETEPGLRQAVCAYIEQHGVEHEDDCPLDDTCECMLIGAINRALAAKKPVIGDPAKEADNFLLTLSLLEDDGPMQHPALQPDEESLAKRHAVRKELIVEMLRRAAGWAPELAIIGPEHPAWKTMLDEDDDWNRGAFANWLDSMKGSVVQLEPPPDATVDVVQQMRAALSKQSLVLVQPIYTLKDARIEGARRIAEDFRKKLHCPECGKAMEPPVSLWRCSCDERLVGTQIDQHIEAVAETMDTTHRRHREVALWDAINGYVLSCGGDPGDATAHGNDRRMNAVVAVNRVVFGE